MVIKSKQNLAIYLYFFSIFLCKGFNMQSDNFIYLAIYLLGLVLVFIKMINDKYKLKEILFILLFILLGVVIYFYSKNITPLFFFISLSCLKNVDLKEIIKIMFYSSLGTFLIMIISSLVGIIPNNVYLINRSGTLLARYCFGYSHPNIAHMQYLIVVVLFFYVYDIKTIMPSVVIFILNYILYKYTGSRTAFYLIDAFLIYQVIFKNKKPVEIFIKYFSKYSFVLFLIFSLVTASLYNSNLYIQKLDQVFTGRIWYSKLLLESYTVPLFGRESYGSILFDNSYFYLIYKCGIVFTLLYALLMYLLVKYCIKNELKKELFYILFFNIFCLTENVFLSINFNFINLFFAYVVFSNTKKKINNDEGDLIE